MPHRKTVSSNNENEKYYLVERKVQYLPALTLGNKDNYEEMKKTNVSLGFENKNVEIIIDGNNKIKSYNVRKIDIELEEDKKDVK